MLPNVYGFTWTPLHLIFLGVFFSVTLVIVATVALAAWRARRDIVKGKTTEIEWHSVFEDLPARDRACRHQFTGEFPGRHCERGFDCRACGTHAALIETHPPQPATDEELFGLRYPADRLYHRGHTWVREESDGTVTVGPDDLSRKMFGRMEQLVLPGVGAQVKANGTGWMVRQRGAELRVLSPVDGEVVEQGGPDDPFYLRIRPTGGTGHLLRGAEVAPWVMRELERLQVLLSPDPSMPALADGGVLVDDAPEAFPEANWPAVWGEMLLEP